MARRKPTDPIMAKIILSSLLCAATTGRVPHAHNQDVSPLAQSIPAHLDDCDHGSGT
jgi:hypothetical protein